MTALISEFGVSPGITFTEVDQTTVTPAVDTTSGAIAGVFRWGPVNDPILVTSEVDLVNKFGKPTNLNAETWFSAANFLAYSNALYVVRAANTTTQFAAVAGGSAAANITVLNQDDFANKQTAINSSSSNYVARWPGELGNSLKVSVCETATQFNSTINLRTDVAGNTYFDNANTKLTIAVGNSTGLITLWGNASLQTGQTPLPTATNVANKITVGDAVEVQDSNGTTQRLKVLSKGTILVANAAGVNTGTASFSLTFDQPLKVSNDIDTVNVVRYWEYSSTFETAPGKSEWVAANGNTALQISDATAQFDEMHVAVIDEDGLFSGTPGAILEAYQGVSRATDAKTSDGATNYYKNVINNSSAYVWAGADRASAPSNTAVNVISANSTAPFTSSFIGGVDLSETALSFGAIASAYDKFASAEDIDISLIITGMTRGGVNGTQLANYLIDNVAEVRRDCVVFISPEKTDVVNTTTAAQNVVDFRNSLRSSSYAMLDSGYKYQYDKYNDVYRYIPLNADIAGLCVRTDALRDPWFSPAGVNRGSIRNVVKLPFNPSRAERDLLYKNGVNPVITQQGIGTILFGDKTLLSTPSAFDRINVRRLFITLQKTITSASNALLFEFNDEFTRAQFRNLVEPFLRDVQGRRGITDFKVVCDETNNTPQVIDTNRFVGDIYIKPARSINFIRLNFVAVRTGVEFTEVVGQ
jgi:hypothetical protein